MTQTKLWLLIVLALLVGLRFIVVPFLDQQQVQREELMVLAKRLDKTQALLTNQDLLQSEISKLRQWHSQQANSLTVGADEQSISLTTQNELQNELENHQVALQMFNWGLSARLNPQSDYFVKEANLTAQANFIAFSQLIAALEDKRGIAVTQFRFSWPEYEPLSQPFVAQIKISVLYKLEPQPETETAVQ